MRIVNIADISPSTAGEKCIACILMITGIGFLSMLTSTISTFFFSAIEKRKLKEKKESKDKEQVIIDISDLSLTQRKNLISYYEFLKSED